MTMDIGTVAPRDDQISRFSPCNLYRCEYIFGKGHDIKAAGDDTVTLPTTSSRPSSRLRVRWRSAVVKKINHRRPLSMRWVFGITPRIARHDQTCSVFSHPHEPYRVIGPHAGPKLPTPEAWASRPAPGSLMAFDELFVILDHLVHDVVNIGRNMLIASRPKHQVGRHMPTHARTRAHTHGIRCIHAASGCGRGCSERWFG